MKQLKQSERLLVTLYLEAGNVCQAESLPSRCGGMCVWNRGDLVLLAAVNHVPKIDNSRSDYTERKILHSVPFSSFIIRHTG